MAKARAASTAQWIGIILLYIAGPAAMGLSERAIDTKQAIPIPTIIWVMLVACAGCALLGWSSRAFAKLADNNAQRGRDERQPGNP